MNLKTKNLTDMKKLIFTTLAVALLCSAGMFSSCSKSDEDNDKQEWVYNPAEDGIIGEWLSEGTNVAPLLSSYFSVVRINATFNKDNTYSVQSIDQEQITTNYVGTYVQTKSSVSGIWTIKLNQTTPSVGASEGIFQITSSEDGYLLTYEVVQTEPDISAIPPTATTGFGSTNGGVLGNTNIQKFVRIN
jgi:hypothetical protein